MEYPSLDKPTAGAFRFNTDSSIMEIYIDNEWTNVLSMPGTNCARIVIGGGEKASPNPNLDTIEFANINTTGNTKDFGNLTVAGAWLTASCSSSTRGVYIGGAPRGDTIDYITIAEQGNAVDFGDPAVNRGAAGGCSNEVRGLYAGGDTGGNKKDSIEFITIAAKSNATDFGDLVSGATGGLTGGMANQVRGIWAGGYTPTALNVIQYVNIMTLGDSIDFGDLTSLASEPAAVFANHTRGIVAGGSGDSNMINSITVASTGNATYFGDISSGGGQSCMGGGCSHTRGIIAGASSPSYNNGIVYITMATFGNSLDFGDLAETKGQGACVTNCHGGLS